MDRNYWVRTEHGRIWGPYTISALERLRGQLTEKCEASLDGKEWLPGADFPELRNLLSPARKIERAAAPPPAAPRISRAVAEAFGIDEAAKAPEVAPAPAAVAPQPAPVPPSPPPQRKPPVMQKAPEKLDIPDSGDLGRVSPVRLYALTALAGASGGFRFELEDGKKLQIVFRRGTPEHVASDDPDLGLLRYLQMKGFLPADKALAAEEQAAKSGQDVLAVLFQLQLIPAADVHRLLGEHGVFLLDRAFSCWRGTFNFEKEATPPPGSFPLGSRWGLLVESIRRLEAPLLRARLGKRLSRPVVRSGGLAVGKVEELGLNAQETRIYAAIDGTKTGEEVLQAHDGSTALRLLYLLTELGHLGFAEIADEAEADPPPAKTAPPAEPVIAPPPPAKPAATAAPATPKINREPPRPAPRPAAPPVMKAAAPSQPAPPKPAAPAISRPAPTFAQGPANESAEAMLKRLAALWERLSQLDHFEALGMERKSATAAEAKRNFFVLAKELHPDTVTDPAQTELKEVKERLFARINEAAQVIGDDKRRKEYERELDGKAENVDVSRIFAAEENFQRAEILIKARKYQEGLELLEQAIQMNPEEAEFFALRGYAKFLVSKDRKQSYEECAADCRKATKMVERCLPAHLYLGHMAKVVGDLKLARKCYSRVVELDEKHVEAQRELRLMGAKA
ncbi:MAG TPA: DnaJ domain-containing protein [Myxococcales bacterium]|nr:DnaJ domain-containing protein [Myxococcales bacterium]